MNNSIENPPTPPPEYPKDWLTEAASRSFKGSSGAWSSVPNPSDPVTAIYLHGRTLSRRTDESALEFIHRAGDWAAGIYREEDIMKLTNAFLGKQEADAKYLKEAQRVFPDWAWFEVGSPPIVVQVRWDCLETMNFTVPIRRYNSDPTTGHLDFAWPIQEIGRQVAPPQENP